MPSEGGDVRKREVVHICDGGDRRAVKCNVGQRCIVECFIAIPVHGKDGGVTLRGTQCMVRSKSLKTYTKPVTARQMTKRQRNAQSM